jgi:hypothetical protein
MKKQTAVEWFFNQLIDKKNQTPEILWAAYLNAKAMEKEQTVHCYEQAYREGYIDNGNSGESYYNETYGGDK